MKKINGKNKYAGYWDKVSALLIRIGAFGIVNLFDQRKSDQIIRGNRKAGIAEKTGNQTQPMPNYVEMEEQSTAV